jgi:Ca2+/H+ antiporter, TMEM165/GDT1 family
VLSGPLEALAVSFGVVFLAELGDKTQLMVLAFATRYRALPVVIGVVAASAAVMAASVLVGAALGTMLPTGLLQLIGGVIFLGFAGWTLLSREEDAEDAEAVARYRPRPPSNVRAALVVAGAFAIAELGDKSMLVTITLAAQGEPLAVWAGATSAMTGLSVVAVVVGRQLGMRLPRRLVRFVAAGAFALFGILLLVDALIG